MGDAPHGPMVFGVEDDTGGGGGGTCVLPIPLAFGSGRIAANTVTRYLQPPGEFTGSNVADINLIPYRVQAPATLTRFELRVRLGAGNGLDVVYEVMLNGAGTGYIITLASTFAGVAAIVGAPIALVDGDELALEIRKDSGIGSSPMDVQAFLRIEADCGGGGGATCCAPQYLSQEMFQAFAFIYIATAGGSLELDASVCGQDEPLTAVIRPSELGGGGVTPPAVTLVSYNPVRNTLNVQWDDTGSDGQFVLEVSNDCGCCYVHPLEALLI